MVDDLHKRRVLVVLESISIQAVVALMIIYYICKRHQRVGLNLANRRHLRYSLISRIPSQISHLGDIINASDQDCINNLRLNRNAFGRLCMLVGQFGGLKGTQSVTIAEQVAMFLSILAHHKKNRIIKHDFKRSGRTVSKYFNDVLLAILRLHSILVVSPEPIGPDSTDERWKWFKGCLGALDGTYIPVKVSEIDKARYRSRKGQICVNVLGVCDKNMNFIYVLTGWEGSAADGRVLRDAVTRPNGLRVPRERSGRLRRPPPPPTARTMGRRVKLERQGV